MKKGFLLLLGALLMVTVATLSSTAQQPDANTIIVYPPIKMADVIRDASSPHGLFPAQIRAAYGFNSVPNQGQGQIIGIVDAFDDPNAEADLQVYDAQFRLPACTTQNGCFTKIKVGNPPGDTNWGYDISLDIQQAHSLAPAAQILLVEANSGSLADLLAAVDVAVAHGANEVSMSWTSTDFFGEQGYDFHFNVPGVTFVASTGDEGHGVGYPAASPYVIGAGGTTLTLSTAVPLSSPLGSNYGIETAWSGGGGGISSYEAGQPYQDGIFSGCGTGGHRCVPDISSDANPNSGVPLYDSYGGFNWSETGGTSVSAPDWAAVFAVVNSSRVQAGKGVLRTPLNDLYTVYNLTGEVDFHDITSGTNGSCGPQCTAGVGYDVVTGLGSPKVDRLVSAFLTVEP